MYKSKLGYCLIEIGFVYMVLAYIFDLPLPVKILIWDIK